MTKREACEFFYKHGNIGPVTYEHSDAIDMLLNNPPTPGQLEAACRMAILAGQTADAVYEARAAILGTEKTTEST